MKKNSIAQVIKAETAKAVQQRVLVHTQMCLDAASMAANDVFNMGPGRAPQFAAAFSRYIKEIAHTADEDTPDLEYTWATIDKRLAQIYGEHFVPAKERYGRG